MVDQDATPGGIARGSWRRALGVGAFAAIAGPPVGAAGLVASMALRDGPGDDGLAGIAAAMLGLAIFSYVIGGLPALLAGIGAAILVRARGTLRYGEAALLALFGTLVSAAPLALRKADAAGEFIDIATAIVPISVGAALVCRWLMGRIGLLPTPLPHGRRGPRSAT